MAYVSLTAERRHKRTDKEWIAEFRAGIVVDEDSEQRVCDITMVAESLGKTVSEVRNKVRALQDKYGDGKIELALNIAEFVESKDESGGKRRGRKRGKLDTAVLDLIEMAEAAREEANETADVA